MAINVKKDLKKERNLSYLNKDFNSFRSDLLEYARVHYGDVINDFSEAGLGGVFLDMAAYVGDVMSFYLDHQFSELSLETATEEGNILQHIRDAGVKIRAASPSFCEVELIISVDAEISRGRYRPVKGQLGTLRAGSVFSSIDGIDFELMEDVDFSETDIQGLLKAETIVDYVDSENNPRKFLVKRNGIVSSGKTTTEKFTIGSFVPFRSITLSNADVSNIISITDSDLNRYYEVESLTHDVIFEAIPNKDQDRDDTAFNLSLEPAPRRFIAEGDFETGRSKIRFGSGITEYESDDIISDPSDYALPLFGERTDFKIDAVDPSILLNSNTLGIAPKESTLTIRYRYGGGLSHNVNARSINSVKTLTMNFNNGVAGIIQNNVINSLSVNNPRQAKGGESRPSIEELRNITFSSKANQSRVVNVQDLIYRVYTMPAKFGKVFRVGVSKSQKANSILVHVISRDKEGGLVISNDALKDNISTYINEYRLVSDSYDIVDAAIINVGVEYIISIENGYNGNSIISRCNVALQTFLAIENMQVGKPINKTDLMNIIINIEGVSSLAGLKIVNKSGTQEERPYSPARMSVEENTRKQKVFPSRGGIFEIRYPDNDIRGAIL
jgi:hypothetical protein